MLLPVDWLLDRCRTTVNVWGDMVGAAIIDKYAGKEISPPQTEAVPNHDPDIQEADSTV